MDMNGKPQFIAGLKEVNVHIVQIKKILKGYNDIATTHPQYINHFVNIEEAYNHTHSSHKRVELKCLNCGLIKTMRLSNLTHKGFSCNVCSDGISYSEKLMASILTKLNIDFIKQLSYDNGKHKYDFYLPRYNVIIETHGLQHYEQGFKKFGKTLEEEQSNDEYKRKLALRHGIKDANYHEIDCRCSTLKWCKPNIEKAMSNYIDMSILTDEDWREADIQAQKSLKIEVCKYWKENKKVNNGLATTQIANIYGIDSSTVRIYLNWGNKNGFCVYSGKEEREASHKNRSVLVYVIKPNGDKWFDETMNIKDLSRQTDISISTIRRNLDKGTLKYGTRVKYDPKYIGSRIVSAEVYDNQHQTNQNT